MALDSNATSKLTRLGGKKRKEKKEKGLIASPGHHLHLPGASPEVAAAAAAAAAAASLHNYL